MKIVFLQKDSFVKIAVMILCAALKQRGHECDVFIESGERDFLHAVINSGAGLYGFSTTTGSEQWALQTAAQLKRHTKTPVLMGGPHPTFFPEVIKEPCLDFICRGEGEEAVADLADALERGSETNSIPNIWSKDQNNEIIRQDVRPFLSNLDEMPWPDFTPYMKYPYLIPYNRDMYPVMAGRGCPYNCSYCFNKNYKKLYHGKGKYIRMRSPEHVIGELAHAKNNLGVRKINFVDDSFFSRPAWLREFAPLYSDQIRLPFIINLEATQVTEELVGLVKKMGCICVRMGVETGNEELRRRVLNKKITNEQIRRAAAIIKHHGISLSTFNILGLPGEGIDQALETYRLNLEIRSNFLQCSLLQPYPGTDLRTWVEEQGLLEESSAPVLEESFFVATQLKIENKKEIVNLQKLMPVMAQFRIPPAVVRAIIKFPPNMLFDSLFRLTFIIKKITTQQLRLLPLLRLGMRTRSYMKPRKKTAAKV